MKNFTFLLVLACIGASAQVPTCCTISVNHENNLLAMNESFAQAHLDPIPFKLEKEKGSMVKFKTGMGEDGQAYLVKSAKQTNKVLFIFHEWWGLNDYIKQEAEKWQEELGDVNVYAIDLYDGHIAAEAPEAQKLMSTMSETRSKAIIDGAIKLVGPNAKIATLGWCMGGAWSLQAALQAGKQAVGCVMYYGMPEQDINRLKTLNCEVLGIFAKQDKFITPDVVKGFEENMKKAGKKLTVYNYDADHAFANPSNPKHNKEYTDDANKKALAFLKGKLSADRQ
jgi:carboxymethylenebutenolidase